MSETRETGPDVFQEGDAVEFLQFGKSQPFRAVLRQRLLELNIQEMTYGWPTEMITKAARQGWRILEVPVDYYPRIGGKSKISGTVRGTILATYYILWTILKYSQSKDLH